MLVAVLSMEYSSEKRYIFNRERPVEINGKLKKILIQE
jgi:hypothetical protein